MLADGGRMPGEEGIVRDEEREPSANDILRTMDEIMDDALLRIEALKPPGPPTSPYATALELSAQWISGDYIGVQDELRKMLKGRGSFMPLAAAGIMLRDVHLPEEDKEQFLIMLVNMATSEQ
jgi:hypothetical protein